MNLFDSYLTRRSWLRGGLTLGAAALFTPGVFAEELGRTPRMTEGPFYPDRLPLDTDNDLVIVNNSITPAVGEITHLTGRLLDVRGEPLRDLVVEIWQVDARGVYLHSGSDGARNRDANFQGFGRCATNARGEYRFRTIRLALYPGSDAAHSRQGELRGDRELLTTQLFVNGHAQNRSDGILRSLCAVRLVASTCWSIFGRSRIRGSGSCRRIAILSSGATPERP